jgi:hypothetical protein
MKKYERPEIKVSVFSSDDVITSSGGNYEAFNSLPLFFEEPDAE